MNEGSGPAQSEIQGLMALFAAHRLAEAEAVARQMILTWPHAGIGWKALGTVLDTEGRPLEALPALQQALVLLPADPETHNTLGNALLATGRVTESEAALRRALTLKPDYVEAHNNLGNMLKESGRLRDAEASYRRALELKPEMHEAYSNLGNVLKDLGRLSEAQECCRHALALKPDFHQAHNNLGSVFQALGMQSDAEACYRRALAIAPISHLAHNNLGGVLQETGQLVEAELHYRRAIELKPDYPEAHRNLGNALKDLGRLVEAEASYRAALSIKPDYCSAYSNLLFMVSRSGRHSDAEYLALAKGYEFAMVPADVRAEARTRIFSRSRRGLRKLRIGYVSGDFRTHSVSNFIERVFEHHDRSRVEVFGFPTIVGRDRMTESIQRKVSQWHGLSGVADADAVELISKLEIDVLIDLSGHTAHNRLGIFARRAAPVQCHYLGYFASTGLSEMDYWVADSILIPEGHDSQYCEEIWRLPRTWLSYAAPVGAPEPVRSEDALGRVWIGSFNHLGKITEDSINLWSRILHRNPGICLLLKAADLSEAENRKRILARFSFHGIPESRIQLLGGTREWAEHMSLYNRIDVALDPVGGSGGGTTTCEALWMGVPVVTLSGSRYAERMATSMLAAIGHGEWAAASRDDYVGKVSLLAADSALRQGLRSSLRDTVRRSFLVDSGGLARSLEGAYEEMFDRWFLRQSNRKTSSGS